MVRDKMMQLQYAKHVEGVSVEGEHVSDHKTTALCRSDQHATVSAERHLRTGNRVMVVVGADDLNAEFDVCELRCAYCPLSVDIGATVIEYDEYDPTNVVIAEATLVRDESGGLELTDPEVISAKVAPPM